MESEKHGDRGRFDLPPDPKAPVPPPPPNGFVVVDELPKPEPKPGQRDDHVRVRTRLEESHGTHLAGKEKEEN